MPEHEHLPGQHRRSVQLFLCGDVVCGRGIDQVPAHPCRAVAENLAKQFHRQASLHPGPLIASLRVVR
jgi:hypothetical protein